MDNITTTLVSLDIVAENPENPRIIYNERALVEDVAERGLDVPLQVRAFTGKKTLITLRGNRRRRCLAIIRKERPDAYKKHFASGIPVVVHTDISDEEAIEITNDHGQFLSLSNEMEIYLTVEGYFRMGLNEKQCLFKIQTLLDHVLPIKGKAAIEVAALKKKLESANDKNRAERLKAYQERYWIARRGVMQRYTRIYKNAAIVKDAMYFKWIKEMPSGYESDLPVLSDTDLKNLSKTFVDEASEGAFDSSGRPMITKSNPGDKWNDAWKDIVISKAGDGDGDKEPRKSKGRKEILKPLQEGLIDSSYMSNVIRHHAADKEVDAKCIHVADQLLAVVEVVQKVDLSLWLECVVVYKQYLEDQRNGETETETETE